MKWTVTLFVVLLVACSQGDSDTLSREVATPAASNTPITTPKATGTTPATTLTPTPTPRATATAPALTPSPTSTAQVHTPKPRSTVAAPALSAEEVLDAATAVVGGGHSGRIEGEFTLEAESGERKIVLTMSVAGEFLTPDHARWSVTGRIQDSGSVDIDDAKVRIGSQTWTEEWIAVEGYLYEMDSHRLQSRYPRDGIELDFELFDVFEFDLLDSDGEISASEQELDGERVYHLTGPAAEDVKYPVLGRAGGVDEDVDGVVDYWIGAEDHLLRRLEFSLVLVIRGRDAGTVRLNGVVTVSDYGKSVDIRAPVLEDADDHGNSPANATEVFAGESVDGSVDSWLDSDYFRFRAEAGRLYHIVVSDEEPYDKWYGTNTTLFSPDGVTQEQTLIESTGQLGTRILWRPPASDTYYLKVESGQQGVDVYTLTITLMPEEDDYGDSPSTAHEIGVEEAVEGLIGQPDDRDYFKLSANEGQVYRIDATPHLEGNYPNVVLHGPGGPLQEASSIDIGDTDTGRILWVAPSQGDYYISVGLFRTGNVGSYTLKVISITDIADDHSDGAANATELPIGETVRGALDYEFDLDYFKFNAEEDQGYRVYINSRTSSFSDLRLYAPDGHTPEPLDKYTHADRDRYQLVWMAREGGTYYLEFRNLFGMTGEYTITVTAVQADPDDHGNDPETATDISIGEVLQGEMDHEFDLDYFRFMANEGQEYLLHVDHETLGDSRVKVYAADGVTEPSDYGRSSGSDGTTQEWVANTSSEYFFEVGSGHGSLGTYTIVIDAVDG